MLSSRTKPSFCELLASLSRCSLIAKGLPLWTLNVSKRPTLCCKPLSSAEMLAFSGESILPLRKISMSLYTNELWVFLCIVCAGAVGQL